MDKLEHIIHPNGGQEWLQNGESYKRENGGPSMISADGQAEWWIGSECHREDGPAIISSSGFGSWYLNSNRYSFNEWCNLVNLSNEKRIEMKLRYG